MWDAFGLERNPYDVKAVEIGGIVPVSTFFGRSDDRIKLSQVISSHNHSLNLIVGDKGVGKTSLGNVVRADLFEKYFVALNEIDTQHYWSSKDFVEHALLSFYLTALQAKTYTELSSRYLKVCESILAEIKPFFLSEQKNLGLQAFGFGAETGATKSFTNAPYALLKVAFKQVVGLAIKNGYSGVILQYNNLDNMEIEPKKLSRLFADLRDFLTTDNAHFIILGNKLMEAGVKYDPKVNECITSDYHIGALDFQTIKKIIEKRYELFKIKDRKPIPPVSNDSVELLCDLFNGNIRQVFYSLNHAVINAEKFIGKVKPLTRDETRLVLNRTAQNRIKGKIDDRAYEVLNFAILKNRDITNTEITKVLKLKAQNTSKYLRQLKENNLMIQSDRIGRKIFYRAVHEARWLMLDPENGIQLEINRW